MKRICYNKKTSGEEIKWPVLKITLAEGDSLIFDDEVRPSRRSACPPRRDDDLVVRWSRSPALSSLSLDGWDMTGSRITLLSHASSSSGGTGSGNNVTPSPTSDFRCVATPSTDGDTASADNDEAGNSTLSLERKRKRKWKRHLTAGTSNYRRLDDKD